MFRYHKNTFITLLGGDTCLSHTFPSQATVKQLDYDLSFMYFNARSLGNKIALLQSYANTSEPKVIAITETWANPDTPDGIYDIPGYCLLRADRSDRRGGGVMIYTHASVNSSEVFFDSYAEFEFLCCKMLSDNGYYVGLLCVYRPPNITSTGDINLVNLIEAFLKLNYRYNIIIGDFNMPFVDWKCFSAPPKYLPFLDCCSKFFLQQHVHEPTRLESDTILDLIFTTVGTNLSSICVDECFGSSDHSVLRFDLELSSSLCIKSDSKVGKRNYNMADWKLMYKLLSDTDWEAVFNHSDINDVWINFKAAVNNAVKASIPTNKRIPWRVKSNPKIRSALRYTRRCHASYKLLRNNESLLKLLHAKDHLQELIDKQVDTYEQYIVSSLHENPNRFWSYVNSKLKNKRNIFKMVKVNNELIEDPSQIAEALNKYFYNSFNHNSNDTGFSSVNMPIADGSKLTDIEINHNLVSSIIKHLPKKRSEDYDGFSYAILRKMEEISSHTSKLAY